MSLRFLVGEGGQAAQTPPIGAARVATVEVGQLLAELTGNRNFDGCGNDVHPSPEIAGTGLQYHTRFVTSGPHGVDDGGSMRSRSTRSRRDCDPQRRDECHVAGWGAQNSKPMKFANAIGQGGGVARGSPPCLEFLQSPK
jgi:hypothetical protein